MRLSILAVDWAAGRQPDTARSVLELTDHSESYLFAEAHSRHREAKRRRRNSGRLFYGRERVVVRLCREGQRLEF